MFGLFKKKSELDKLNDKYVRLLKEARELSTSNRKLSDSKTAEADALLKEIGAMESTHGLLTRNGKES